MATTAAYETEAASAPRSPFSPSALRLPSSGKLDAVAGLALFRGADIADLRRLAEVALLRHFGRGRTILRGGASDCVVLVAGRAKTVIVRGASCGELALGIFDSGEILWDGGWGSLVAQDFGDTVALEPSTALFVPRRSLEAFLERNPRVAIQFVQAVAAQWHRVTQMAVENHCLEIGERLTRRLGSLAEKRGNRLPDGSLRIDHGLLQSELAAIIGASREAVNRQLAAWRQEGLVVTSRRSMVVRDPLLLSMTSAAPSRDGRRASAR